MIHSSSLKTLANQLHGQLTMPEAESLVVTGMSIDSRSIKRGELFVAIKGPRFDGHDYLQQAKRAGAVAAVVDRTVDIPELPQIVVTDTFKALGALGAMNRLAFTGVVLAVTGSCGKTSVKTMLASVMAESVYTFATEGNLNNGYGVPLTLFQIKAAHGAAVIELGTSSPGEIAYIAGLTKPDVAMITNAAEAHLDGLKSVAGVAHEKGFILDALSGTGVAILNRDDAFYSEWHDRVHQVAGRKSLTFSMDSPDADCYASRIGSSDNGMRFDLHLGGECRPVSLAFWGRHQVANACCVAVAAFSAGLGLDSIVRGLESARPYQRRGQRYVLSGKSDKGSGAKEIVVFDETYNANPRATLAAIDQLSECSGKRIMVFGDMLELGAVSSTKHQEIGSYAKQQGVDYFAGFGGQARLACEAFGKKGRHFESKAALSDWVDSLTGEAPGKRVSVLVKGSKGMEMLDVVRSLVGPEYEGER